MKKDNNNFHFKESMQNIYPRIQETRYMLLFSCFGSHPPFYPIYLLNTPGVSLSNSALWTSGAG